MGSPGHRRRSGRHSWLGDLISRARPGKRGRRRQEAVFRLLAEPAEFAWPDHSDAERPQHDSADGWPADPAAYQWIDGWTDEPAPRRLLDGPPDPGWSAEVPPVGEPAAATRFAGYAADQLSPHLGGRRRAGRPSPGWLGQITQRDWYLALARYRWYVAVSAGAGAMALASGVILLLPHQPGRAMTTDARSAPAPARPSHPAS